MFKDDGREVSRMRHSASWKPRSDQFVAKAALLSRLWQLEIERAIDGVKCRCHQLRIDGRQATPATSVRATRRGHHSGSLSPHSQRERFWGDNRVRSVAEESELVTVRGKVPRQFFEWLKDQVQIDWRNRKLLEKCFFG
jgi:hypothetical protein